MSSRTASRRRACSSSCATTPGSSSRVTPSTYEGSAGRARNGTRDVRFRIGALPLADGRFHLRLGLTDERGEHVYHWLDDALVFVVYPGDDVRGVVRFEGTWMLEENSAGL